MPTAQATLPCGTSLQMFLGGRRTQAEGGEQGDPLMPFLFANGIHGALEEVASSMEHGEQFCAFLDDV